MFPIDKLEKREAPRTRIDSVEALSWLEQPDGKDRTIGSDSAACLHTEDALRLVRELYAAGATAVVTVEYEFENASSLTVVLPQDRGKRAALFAIEVRALHELGSSLEPAGERGQVEFSLGW